MEDTLESVKEFNEEVEENSLKKSKRNGTFKTKKCNVISYNRKTKKLDIDFDGYGIRLNDIENFEGNTVEIRYKGNIGKPNFVYKI